MDAPPVQMDVASHAELCSLPRVSVGAFVVLLLLVLVPGRVECDVSNLFGNKFTMNPGPQDFAKAGAGQAEARRQRNASVSENGRPSRRTTARTSVTFWNRGHSAARVATLSTGTSLTLCRTSPGRRPTSL